MSETVVRDNRYIKYIDLCPACQAVARENGKVMPSKLCKEDMKKYWNGVHDEKKKWNKKRAPTKRGITLKLNDRVKEKYRELLVELVAERDVLDAEIEKIKERIQE